MSAPLRVVTDADREAVATLEQSCVRAIPEGEVAVARWRAAAVARGEPASVLDYVELDARRLVARNSEEMLISKALAGEPQVQVEHVSESVAKALDEIQAPKLGIATPFHGLNTWITGGFQPGELVYLGARPGVGKTAMALEIARGAAKAGRKVLIVSREMLSAALARRMLSQEGMIPAHELKLGRTDTDRACEVGQRLSDLSIWITDSARSLDEVRAALGCVSDANLLIVDYLQLVQAPREIRERRLQVEHVSQGLKALALERQLPILCLSSLSRPPSGTNPEPTLASLRESGELEHDADIVIFLHRELKNDSRTLCIVAKNRDGGTGASRLVFQPEYVSFHEEAFGE
jgi:replicative DNA helicase